MLKLTYSEFGLRLEKLDDSLEQWVAQHSILALRIGNSICFQPGNAAFLIPANAITAVVDLDRITSPHSPISFSCADKDFYEVNISGVWLFKNGNGAEGLFATSLDEQVESCVRQLWKISQQEVPAYSELRAED
jgi:hypothetical protein